MTKSYRFYTVAYIYCKSRKRFRENITKTNMWPKRKRCQIDKSNTRELIILRVIWERQRMYSERIEINQRICETSWKIIYRKRDVGDGMLTQRNVLTWKLPRLSADKFSPSKSGDKSKSMDNKEYCRK